ncbi:MAG: hypothetical protein QNJ53_31045 [Pleurocapsa sp. MO_192.B19]|nr:hypothetical protein [Pleurocapsa sp. MO_192.B19]
MNDLIYRQCGRSLLLNKNLKLLSLKAFLFLLSTAAMLAPSLSARAEIIMGIIETYNPQSRQATINLGKKDGVGKYDRGKIQLTSLDSPNIKFIGANIVVISVDENSAVVSVREAPGIQVPIQEGAEVTLDTNSGVARREEEAKIIAAQQAEEARRQEQLEAARAEQVRLQQEAEAERAEQARLQQEAEAKRAELARLQQEAEARRAEQARLQQEAEEARVAEENRDRQQSDVAVTPKTSPQTEQPKKTVDLDEAKNLWLESESSEDSKVDTTDLPLDYLQAYTNAREKPSPETYYRFAQVLINYEISDKALEWLDETRSRFPTTRGVNNLYRAVALIQQGKIDRGQSILEASNLPQGQLTNEFESYLYTQKGEWDKVFALSEATKSAATYNNYLIALYCTEPLSFNRDTDLSPSDCPFGSAPPKPEENEKDVDKDEDVDDEDAALAEVQSIETKKTFEKIGKQAIAAYPKDPYILNTLGFIALQSEDYQLAFEHYQQLANLLDQYDSTPPRLQLLKANAISYVSNYNQNYDFLAENSEDLELLRSEQNTLTTAIIVGGVGNTVASVIRNDVSPVSIVGGVLAAFLSINQSKSKAESIAQERNSVLDQMHLTFTRDIKLVPAPPELEANSLIELTSSRIDQQLRRFDDFWEKNKIN